MTTSDQPMRFALGGAHTLTSAPVHGALVPGDAGALAAQAGDLAMAMGADGLAVALGSGVCAWHIDLSQPDKTAWSQLVRAWGLRHRLMLVLPSTTRPQDALDFLAQLPSFALGHTPLLWISPELTPPFCLSYRLCNCHTAWARWRLVLAVRR